jgi:hypothetical protein
MSNPYRNALAEMVQRWYAASGDQDLLDVADAMDHARTLLAQPPKPFGYGEPARFAAWLRKHSSDCMELGRPDWAHMISRAAELLEQHPTPPHTP